jgi:hypothetical protein
LRADEPFPVEEVVASKNKEKDTFLKYLIRAKGGNDFILDTFDSLLDLARNFGRENKLYQSTLRTLKYASPAYFLTKELTDHYRDYRRSSKDTKRDAYADKIATLKDFMGIEEIDHMRGTDLCGEELHLGPDIVSWIFSKPKTTNFLIKGFYELESMKKVSDIFSIERGSMMIPIEFEEVPFVWEFVFTRFEDDMNVHDTTLHYMGKYRKKAKRLKDTIFKEFMEHFDIENNVLIFKPSGISSRPRLKTIETINQFDTKSFADEVLKVLQRGIKRGYAFVGVPGVGKSTILRALETITNLTGYPIVYIDKDCMSYESAIREYFRKLRKMGMPFIAILEDADSCGIAEKNSKLGCFLNEIDSVNRNLNGVFIMTVNDTSLVHYTAINRPGRFDEVIKINPPSTAKEVYEVLETQYNRRALEGTYINGTHFIGYEKINQDLLTNIYKVESTQADICEVMEKALLISVDLTNDILSKAFENLKKSKQAIKDCNFRDLEPNSSGSVYDDPCCEEVKCAEEITYKIPA